MTQKTTAHWVSTVNDDIVRVGAVERFCVRKILQPPEREKTPWEVFWHIGDSFGVLRRFASRREAVAFVLQLTGEVEQYDDGV